MANGVWVIFKSKSLKARFKGESHGIFFMSCLKSPCLSPGLRQPAVTYFGAGLVSVPAPKAL